MRAADIDTSARVWIYRPANHKTAHLGHSREIHIGPQAQELLKPFLKADLQAYIFSPADAERERHQEQRRQRRTPVQPSQVQRAEKAAKRRRNRPPGDRYNVRSYRRAIARACDIAFPPPAPLARRPNETITQWKARLTPTQKVELRQWRARNRWHPHQLRHAAATKLRRLYGVEAARIILGHKSIPTAEIYAERDTAKAGQIIGEVG